jgi:anti-sigma28 factor (negative regulator of flagellin synthesis)
MVSSIKGSMIKGAYQDASMKTKEQQDRSAQSINKQGDTSRIEELKSSIEKGEYRVDIEALAKRIAHELT